MKYKHIETENKVIGIIGGGASMGVEILKAELNHRGIPMLVIDSPEIAPPTLSANGNPMIFHRTHELVRIPLTRKERRKQKRKK